VKIWLKVSVENQEGFCLKIQFVKFGLVGALLAVSLGLFVACGDTGNSAAGVTPPDKPCVIVEQKKPGDENQTLLLLDLDSSPSYCKKVTDDYKATMKWYQSQVKDNNYAPNMSAELENYYTGELLQETRASLFYNMQAGRVVLGRWQTGSDQISGPNWAKDGLTATLLVKPAGYEQVSFPVGQPDKATIQKGGAYESWLVSLVYDAKAERWKISQAQTIFTKPDKAQG
jgi:hypothetical protein